ncbi:DUF6636 domain-containing protein [Roseovarius sp. THAF9]|uniref:DUF6636 domain-containing protein n=1 Tax=Roseovarius sp. THAF9 TaxID=2587847 RepID=UPI001268E2F8
MRILTALPFLFASPALADVFLFETPSGNIECSVGIGQTSSDIICEIIEKTGPDAQPRPSNCSATWGHKFSMLETGTVQMECANTPRNSDIAEKAPYGVSATWGEITCWSERTGFECRNASGHGFFLSRRVQRVY